jgi:hypothetical protein
MVGGPAAALRYGGACRSGRPGFVVVRRPATAGDAELDTRTRRGPAELGAGPPVVGALLNGGTLRGVTDDEPTALTKPVGVLSSVPENPFHRRRTVDALLHVLPRAGELPGCPEPPHRHFPPTWTRSSAPSSPSP